MGSSNLFNYCYTKKDSYYQKILNKLGDKAKDKYQELLLEALGFDKNSLNLLMKTNVSMKSATANTIIEIDHDRKTYQVHLTLTINSFAIDKDNAFAGQGYINYYITDKKGNRVDGSVGEKGRLGAAITQTDLNQFGKSIESVAKQSVKNIYNSLIADAIDSKVDKLRKQINKSDRSCKLVTMLTSDITAKLIKERYGKFSNNVFKISAKQVEKFYKTTAIKCPVDVYIYNFEDELCGTVINNEAKVYSKEIAIEVIGDEKYVSFADDDYRFELVGNDSGTMTYEVTTYSEDGELIRKTVYSDIPLQKGLGYSSTIVDNPFIDNVSCDPISDNGDIIEAISDSYLDTLEPYVSVDGIKVDTDTVTLKVGEEYKLNANVTPKNAYNQCLIYTMADDSIAEVLNDGTVVAKSNGTTTLTVSTEESGFSKEISINVTSDTDTDIQKDTDSDIKKNTDTDKSSDTKNNTDTDKNSDTKKNTDTDKSSDTKNNTDTDTNSDVNKNSDTDTPPKSPTPIGTVGDLDGDGRITSADSLSILRASVKLQHYDDVKSKLADIDKDGNISSSDALLVLRHSVGFKDTSYIGTILTE